MGFLLLASQEDEYSLSDIVHYTESFLLWFGDSFTPILSVSLQTDIHILFRPVVALNLLFLGVIASMLCYIMWNTAVKQLGVVCATSYIYVVPLITLLTSAIVIDETITIVALLGSALILSGVYIAERGVNLKK